MLGSVNSYEVLLLLDPELAEERQGEIVERTRALIERDGGGWETHEVWGRRKLAYEIDHKGEGTYHLLVFHAQPETLNEISRVLKITDGVMRHMPLRRADAKPPEVAPKQPEAAPAQG